MNESLLSHDENRWHYFWFQPWTILRFPIDWHICLLVLLIKRTCVIFWTKEETAISPTYACDYIANIMEIFSSWYIDLPGNYCIWEAVVEYHLPVTRWFNPRPSSSKIRSKTQANIHRTLPSNGLSDPKKTPVQASSSPPSLLRSRTNFYANPKHKIFFTPNKSDHFLGAVIKGCFLCWEVGEGEGE